MSHTYQIAWLILAFSVVGLIACGVVELKFRQFRCRQRKRQLDQLMGRHR